MPIIAAVVPTLAFCTLYWFVGMGGINHWRERAAQRKEAAQKSQNQAFARSVQLRAVDDPRDAATILMLLIPRGRDPTSEQIARIEATVRDTFEFGPELVARMTQARFIAGAAESFEQAVKVFADLFKKGLTAAELLQLVSMVEEIAHCDGPTQTQIEAITMLQQRLGLVPTE